jgi:small nuclear ribonucleoprotein (snRNP)-like protein
MIFSYLRLWLIDEVYIYVHKRQTLLAELKAFDPVCNVLCRKAFDKQRFNYRQSQIISMWL